MRNSYKWFGTRYNYYDSSFRDISNTGITIEKPIDINNLINATQIKAVELEYGDSFRRAKVDFIEYLEEILNWTKLEYLKIQCHSKEELVIPEIIEKHQLKHLEIVSSPISDLSFISSLTFLESFAIGFSGQIDIPSDIKLCENIRKLAINIAGGDISAIYKMKSLEDVKLGINDLEHIDFFTSSKIKSLRITSKCLKSFDNKTNLERLENLYVRSESNVVIPINYFSGNLSEIQLYGQGIRPALPSILNSVKKMTLYCYEIPPLNAPLLKDLKLKLTADTSLDKCLHDTPELEALHLESMEDFDCKVDSEKVRKLLKYTIAEVSTSNEVLDLSSFENLAVVGISNGNRVKLILPETDTLGSVRINNVNNRVLDLRKMNDTVQIPHRNGQNVITHEKSNNAVIIQKCTELKEVVFSCYAKKIETSRCNNLKLISFDGLPLSLKQLTIFNCDKLRKLPAEILLGNESLYFKLQSSNFSFDADMFRKIIKDLAQEMERTEILKVGKYIFEGDHQYIPNMISALSIKSRPTFKLIETFLTRVSKNETEFDKLSLGDVAGKSIAIAGKPYEKKTVLKEHIKRLGMEYFSKPENADLVIVGFRSELVFNPNQIYIRETDFETFSQREKPRFLVASASKEQVDKIRLIMSSRDPKSENLALEILKKGGLLKEVIGEAVLISKSSIDASVKRKYKSFLKGKVNEDWQKVMSSQKRNTYWLPNSIKGDYFRAKYLREGSEYYEFIRHNRKDFDMRIEVVKKYLFQKAKDRPHYIDMPPLYKSELKLILDLPEIEGKLKRLKIFMIDGVPDNLSKHFTLKELEIRSNESVKLPHQIYKLSRLSILDFYSDNLEFIADDISNLLKLKSIWISSKKTISIPKNLLDLPKLKPFSFKNKVREND